MYAINRNKIYCVSFTKQTVQCEFVRCCCTFDIAQQKLSFRMNEKKSVSASTEYELKIFYAVDKFFYVHTLEDVPCVNDNRQQLNKNKV